MCAFAFTPDLFHFANKRAIESERERLYLGFYSIFLGSFMLARSRSVVVAIERQRKDFGSCLGALDACVHGEDFFFFPVACWGWWGDPVVERVGWWWWGEYREKVEGECWMSLCGVDALFESGSAFVPPERLGTDLRIKPMSLTNSLSLLQFLWPTHWLTFQYLITYYFVSQSNVNVWGWCLAFSTSCWT